MGAIVITGIGIISPSGLGKEIFWETVRERRRSTLKNEAGDEQSNRIHDFCESLYIDAKTSKYAQRVEKLALVSSALALADAGLDAKAASEMRMGVALGTMTSNLRAAAAFDRQVLEGEAAFIDPALVPSGILNSLSGIVSIQNGIRGFHVPVAAGEASSMQALQFAMMQLENDRVDAVLAGGVEEIVEDLRLVDSVTDGGDEEADERAGQFGLAEAAAILVLEHARHAAARGAKPYAECVGYGCAYVSKSAANRDRAIHAAAQTIEEILQASGIGAADIDLVLSNCAGASAVDCIEAEAMRRVFKARMPEVIGLKAIVGDSLGASGALQTAAGAMALKSSANGEKRHVLISAFSRSGHMSFLVLRAVFD